MKLTYNQTGTTNMKETNNEHLTPLEESAPTDKWKLNYNLNNVAKHVSRAEKKDGDPLDDLKKAKWYLEREILILERSSTDWNFDREQLKTLKSGHNF